MPTITSLESYIPDIKRLGKSGRRLTPDEWNMVHEAIKQYELPCELHSTAFGFALYIYLHGEIPKVAPEELLVLGDDRLPFPSAKGGFAGQGETLRHLSLIVYTPRNKELLGWYGFEPLKERIGEYAY